MDQRSIPFVLLSFKTGCVMTWCNAHDDMTRCNTQANDTATTRNNWRTPGTSVSGRYNTPPLREDLVPRSRMAPEGQRKRKRRGKTKLLLWQTSETKEPLGVEQIERNNTTEVIEVKNTPLETRNKEEQIRTALQLNGRKRTWSWQDQRILEKNKDTTLRLNKIEKE